MFKLVGPAAFAVALVCASSAVAQDAIVVAAGTAVDFEIVDTVSSKSAARGDKFAIRLVQPVVVNGQTVAEIGATGFGEVVHAQKPRAGGKPGELILTARQIDLKGGALPLRRFTVTAHGKNGMGASVAVAIAAGAVSSAAGPVAMFVTGGQTEIPAGTGARAYVAADTAITLPAALVPAAAPAAANPETAP